MITTDNILGKLLAWFPGTDFDILLITVCIGNNVHKPSEIEGFIIFWFFIDASRRRAALDTDKSRLYK